MRIAFGSQARSGKDTAAKYLASKCKKSVILSFAQPLYDIMHYTQETCGFQKEKDRELLRTIGMWARKKDEDTWVNILVKKIENIDKNINIFVTDVRFPNEYEALKKLGFLLVKITRDTNDENLRNHESETALTGYEWDFNFDNNGTFEEFQHKLDELRWFTSIIF